jgi:hypothetical protein
MNEIKTLKEMKLENKEYYETQIEAEKKVIKESWDKLIDINKNDSKDLSMASIRVIVSQIQNASESVGHCGAKLLETKIWLIENQFEKDIKVEVWK